MNFHVVDRLAVDFFACYGNPMQKKQCWRQLHFGDRYCSTAGHAQ